MIEQSPVICSWWDMHQKVELDWIVTVLLHIWIVYFLCIYGIKTVHVIWWWWWWSLLARRRRFPDAYRTGR